MVRLCREHPIPRFHDGTALDTLTSQTSKTVERRRILGWASILLVLAIIAGVLGFSGLPQPAGTAARSAFLAFFGAFLAILLFASFRKGAS